MNEHFDLIILGSGPGGYVAAIRAAQLKLKVAVIEKKDFGGICLNWGCIPTKALLRSAEIYQLLKHSNDFGVKSENVEIDFPKIIQRSRRIANRLSKGVQYLLKKNAITSIKGTGKIVSQREIFVLDENGKEVDSITADHIIIATGASPRSIPGVTIDEHTIISSKKAMSLSVQPKSLIIIGAGAIGIEFAYFYNSIGTNVTVVEMMPSILPQEDKEISNILEKQFLKQKITIHTNSKVEHIIPGDSAVTVQVSKQQDKLDLKADIALIAIGVKPNSQNIGLEDLGIETDHGWIKTNKYYQTNFENIYAIGDVIGAPWLAHVASMEGIIAIEHLSNQQKQIPVLDYTSIPACTYCKPQIASIGLTEEQAIERGHEIEIGRFPFQANGKALALGEHTGLTKLIFDKSNRNLLGAHIIHAEATELIAELSLFKTNNLTVNNLMNTLHPHPTLSESISEAAADALNEAIHI